jgi:tRNA pseudouridine38-40 synthase
VRAYRLAYDGRPFRGFQRQPDVPTVEDALFDALRDLGVLAPDAAKPEGYAAAGRTDAGVSALGQTVAFEAPDWLTPAALNSDLPGSIRAWASADVSSEFHATYDARERTYRYHLHGLDLDAERAAAALDALRGEHDFHNLTPDDEGTVRTLRGSLRRDGDVLVVELRAGGFPRQFVRRAVELLREVASSESPLEKVERVLAPDPLPGPEGIGPAPAEPLVLVEVAYPVQFRVDEEARESARAVFAERHAERAAAARVARDLRDGV